MPRVSSLTQVTHADLVDRAGKWLRSRKYHVVFLEHESTHETPDAIGWTAKGRSALIECKTSRADFLNDARKRSRQSTRIGIGELRYYMAPSGVLQLAEIPPGWGLLEVHEGPSRTFVREVRKSGVHKLGVHQLRNELRMLVSEVRLYQGISSGELDPMMSKRVQAIQADLQRLWEGRK